MHVLLVEDEPDLQFIARLALEDAGHCVTVVADGQSAIDTARRTGFDVVLLDVMLPGMNGLEVCRRLKQHAATATLPVIFLTAKSQESEIQHGLSLGVHGYIIKPFDVYTLPTQIVALLSRQPKALGT